MTELTINCHKFTINYFGNIVTINVINLQTMDRYDGYLYIHNNYGIWKYAENLYDTIILSLENYPEHIGDSLDFRSESFIRCNIIFSVDIIIHINEKYKSMNDEVFIQMKLL